MTDTYVLIKNGYWRTQKIENQIFKVHNPFKPAGHGKNEGTVTVKGTPENGLGIGIKCRIDVHLDDIQYVDIDGNPVDYVAASTVNVGEMFTSMSNINYEKEFRELESEEAAIKRIGHTFDMFGQIVDAVPNGHIKGLIVSGPPGIGKTHTVTESLSSILDNENKFILVKGYASPIAIYKTLYRYSREDCVVVFDDCDDAFKDETALNILKAALDSSKHRDICWLAESRALILDDIPNTFRFHGGVILLTNTDFERSTAPTLRDHFAAMMSRCHYLDLEIGSQRDQMLRIKQIVNQGLLDEYRLRDNERDEVLDFIYTNFNFLRETSLRMVKKVAEVYKAQPHNWRSFAEFTCLKKAARYERLYKEQLKLVDLDPTLKLGELVTQ
jgi:DNA polymerase III delta prime subunit